MQNFLVGSSQRLSVRPIHTRSNIETTPRGYLGIRRGIPRRMPNSTPVKNGLIPAVVQVMSAWFVNNGYTFMKFVQR